MTTQRVQIWAEIAISFTAFEMNEISIMPICKMAVLIYNIQIFLRELVK